jgi:hypothetical protein
MAATRPVRANRGNRLKELIRHGIDDDDALAEEWKERADDDVALAPSASPSDSEDSDFSASEHSSQLSDAEAEDDGDAPRPAAKGAPQLTRKRDRKTSTIPQEVRMASAFEYAAENRGRSVLETQPSGTRAERKNKNADRSTIYRSSATMLAANGVSHVLGV